MTDTEKQAIEKLHNGKKIDLISIIRTFKREGIENFVVTKKETIETILNLIEKQQTEIEKLRNNNKDLLRKLRNRAKEVKKLIRYSLYKKEFTTLNTQIKKKDNEIKCLKSLHNTQVKIIDEMASYIAGLDIEEDICVKTGRLGECDSMAYGECEACIKQYFKKKVETEEK